MTLQDLIDASDRANARLTSYRDLRERVGDEHEDEEDQHDQ